MPSENKKLVRGLVLQVLWPTRLYGDKLASQLLRHLVILVHHLLPLRSQNALLGHSHMDLPQPKQPRLRGQCTIKVLLLHSRNALALPIEGHPILPRPLPQRCQDSALQPNQDPTSDHQPTMDHQEGILEDIPRLWTHRLVIHTGNLRNSLSRVIIPKIMLLLVDIQFLSHSKCYRLNNRPSRCTPSNLLPAKVSHPKLLSHQENNQLPLIPVLGAESVLIISTSWQY